MNANLRLTLALRLTVALVAGSLSSLCMGAPGDLDPSFGQVGRLGPLSGANGPFQALGPGDGDGFLVAGGDYVTVCEPPCIEDPQYTSSTHGFAGRVAASGAADPVLSLFGLADIQVLAVARQPDGKIIGVGRSIQDDVSKLAVVRLDGDGVLDPTFADGGVARFGTADTYAVATSVVLDPDGRIVVAGRRNSNVLVMALDTNGTVDESFGDGGFHVGPSSRLIVAAAPRIVRTASGAYRVTDHYSSRLVDFRPPVECRLLGLTAAGTPDTDFGALGDGTVGITNSVRGASCGSLIAEPDGTLLVAGRDGSQGLLLRVLAGGGIDPGFSAEAVRAAMTAVTALAVGPDGSVLVAGPRDGDNGALVMRLHADGQRELSYGRGGSTWIDLANDFGSALDVRGIGLLPDGGVLLIGNDQGTDTLRPFVARLLGDGVTASPGVVGIKKSSIVVTESDGEAIVTVRRMGGAGGAVSIAYSSSPRDASATEDYVAVEGDLLWADGDASDKEIIVPIVIDDAVEGAETFTLTLADPHGGIGLGSSGALVEIAGDEYPSGLLNLELSAPSVAEGDVVEVTVRRDFHAVGEVSITLTAFAGSASSDDYELDPVTLTWADGDSTSRTVRVAATDDHADEPDESFMIQLDPLTGAAEFGTANAEITITDDDAPAPPSGDSSGGGGLASALTLLLLAVARSARKRSFASGSQG